MFLVHMIFTNLTLYVSFFFSYTSISLIKIRNNVLFFSVRFRNGQCSIVSQLQMLMCHFFFHLLYFTDIVAAALRKLSLSWLFKLFHTYYGLFDMPWQPLSMDSWKLKNLPTSCCPVAFMAVGSTPLTCTLATTSAASTIQLTTAASGGAICTTLERNCLFQWKPFTQMLAIHRNIQYSSMSLQLSSHLFATYDTMFTPAA